MHKSSVYGYWKNNRAGLKRFKWAVRCNSIGTQGCSDRSNRVLVCTDLVL
eukprot:XP_001706569.1 Hypothetical protein GL50803_36122 [Giardia lamblia ATCC 50803]